MSDLFSTLSKREYYAAHAPITIQDAIERINNTPLSERDLSYAGILRTLAQIRFDYADALIAQENNTITKAEGSI